MQSWKNNIKWYIRYRTLSRDFFIKIIYNPIQIFRRRSGLAEKDMFRHVLIQTNYTCNRHCSFCHHGHSNPPEKINLDEQLYSSIIDQLSAIHYKGRLGLFEMNEPLTDKRLVTFLRHAREKLPKAWIFISSNGDLLNKGLAELLFRHGLNFIYMSSYDAKALARNHLLLKEMSPSSAKRIHHIDRSYQTEWTSRGGNIETFKRKMVPAPCDLPCRVLYVKPTGKVHSCYNDLFDVNVMGDLNTETIRNVWFGENFTKLRQNLHKGNRLHSQLCRQCDYIGYSNLPKIPLRWRATRLFS